MRHTFETLGYQSGFYLSHLFSSTRNPSSSSSSSTTSSAVTAIHPPPPLNNWPHHHQPPLLPSATTSSINLSSPAHFHNSSTLLGLSSNIPHHHQPSKDQSHLFLNNNSNNNHHPSDHQSPPARDLTWQNGLSFLNADGAAATDKLFHNPDTASDEFHHQKQESNMDDYKFRRSFSTLPSTMALSSSSASLMDRNQHQQQSMDYRKSEGGPYQDVM